MLGSLTLGDITREYRVSMVFWGSTLILTSGSVSIVYGAFRKFTSVFSFGLCRYKVIVKFTSVSSSGLARYEVFGKVTSVFFRSSQVRSFWKIYFGFFFRSSQV